MYLMKRNCRYQRYQGFVAVSPAASDPGNSAAPTTPISSTGSDIESADTEDQSDVDERNSIASSPDDIDISILKHRAISQSMLHKYLIKSYVPIWYMYATLSN